MTRRIIWLLRILLCLIVLVIKQEQVSCHVFFEDEGDTPYVHLGAHSVLSGYVLISRQNLPFSAFIGIPYATIPKRFAEAELISEPLSWSGVKSVKEPGPKCPQASFLSQHEGSGSEDCLNLNVFVPVRNSSRNGGYPVMVFVHGGGLMYGSNNDQGPPFFVDEGIVVVSINYRLGVFGFASTGDEVIPGNNGLKDMVVALRWVQQNIQKFGGDPNLVTLIGESSGGTAVNFLMLSPITKGLFHRVIAQSGSAMEGESYFHNPRDILVELATHMKCKTKASQPNGISSLEIRSCLEAASTYKLNKAQYEFKTSWPMNKQDFFFEVSREPKSLIGTSSLTPFITDSPYSILLNKTFPISEVPLMIGMTLDEGACIYSGFILKNEDLTNELNTKWDEIAPNALHFGKSTTKQDLPTVSEKIRKFYFGSEKISHKMRDNLTNLNSDVFVNFGVYKTALETAKRGKTHPVYLYLYGWSGPISLIPHFCPCIEEEAKKVGHGDPTFHQFDAQMGPNGDRVIKPGSKHEQFSKNFVKLWVSFAIHGEPRYFWGNSTRKKWNPISPEEASGNKSLSWYKIDANPGHISYDPYKDRMEFWDQLHKDHFSSILLSSQNETNEENDVYECEIKIEL